VNAAISPARAPQFLEPVLDDDEAGQRRTGTLIGGRAVRETAAGDVVDAAAVLPSRLSIEA